MTEPAPVAQRTPAEIGQWLYRRILDFGGSAVGAHLCAAAMVELMETVDRGNAVREMKHG